MSLTMLRSICDNAIVADLDIPLERQCCCRKSHLHIFILFRPIKSDNAIVALSLLRHWQYRLCGIVPGRIRKLKLLYELDVSNNRFVGAFPMVILDLPELKYLDLWFNDFKGEFPPTLFDKKLDVIFLNGNRFHSTIPENLGNFPASVIVLANNNIIGFIPKSVRNMAGKLDEFIASHNELSCCLPQEITLLNTKTVFDVSFNKFMGDLPRVINIANNRFRSMVAQTMCTLPNLSNFTFSFNYDLDYDLDYHLF
ncbi:hypothetical protein ACS0TY_018799 [Phlomoides rotata]